MPENMRDYETNHMLIYALCLETLHFIGTEQRKLDRHSFYYQDQFLFLEEQKREVGQLCCSYSNYLEESTFDTPLVTDETVEEVRLYMVNIKRKIQEHVSSTLQETRGLETFFLLKRVARMLSTHLLSTKYHFSLS